MLNTEEAKIALAIVCLCSVISTQGREAPWVGSIPSSEFDRLPGCWVYVAEFVTTAVDQALFSEAAAEVRRQRVRAPDELVRAYSELEQYLDSLAAKGGQSARFVAEEDTVWVPEEGNNFAWRKMSVPGSTPRPEGEYVWQVLVEDDWTVSRSDTGSGTQFLIMDREPDNNVKALFLHEQARLHLAIIEFFVTHGVATGFGYQLEQAAIDRHMPTGFAMPITASRGLLRVNRNGGYIEFSASLFDGAGKVLREYESAWLDGKGCRKLVLKKFLEGQGVLLERTSILIKGHSMSRAMPDIVQIASVPHVVRTGWDHRLKGGGAHFDPTLGFPAAGALRSRLSQGNLSDTKLESDTREAVEPNASDLLAYSEPTWIRERIAADRDSQMSKDSIVWGAVKSVLVGGLWMVCGILGAWIWMNKSRRSRAGATVMTFAAMACALSAGACRKHCEDVAVNSICQLQASQAGSVFLMPESIDVTIKSGEIRRADILFSNHTERAVAIRSVTGACGCVFAVPPTESIGPYESCQIPIELGGDGYEGFVRVVWQSLEEEGCEHVCKLRVRIRTLTASDCK